MRHSLLLLPSLALGGLLLACAPSSTPQAPSADTSREQRRQVQLMDEIEAGIPIPRGASALTAYARFYAFDADGKVAARYIVPPPTILSPDGKCSEVLSNGRWRRGNCPPIGPWADGARAGERRWFADRNRMPIMFDGGCAQVNILYDPRTRRFERVSCNGFA